MGTRQPQRSRRARLVSRSPGAATTTTASKPTDTTVALPKRPLRRRWTVRRVDPWSVLKLSLIFYFCGLLIVMVGLTILWSVIIRLGLLDAATGFLEEFEITARINGGNLARVVFLIGVVNVVLWSALNVFLAFLYNLTADVVGGLRLTLEDPAER